MIPSIRFAADQQGFSKTLNQRVDDYFKRENLSKKANGAVIFKTIAMLSIYCIPYFIIVSGVVSSIGVYYLLWAIMGVGMAGIGMSIMHDANHGAYSNKPWVNKLLGHSLSLVGGGVFNWKVQHNVLHHTYTNIEGVDEDITPRGILRFSPHTNWRPIYRYQYIYAWLLYGLLSAAWIFYKDFERLAKYTRNGIVKKQKTTVQKEWTILIAVKLFYIAYVLVVPILVLPLAWPHIIGGFFVMHYASGIILANVFQVAHVLGEVDYPVLDDKGNIEDPWAVHQVRTAIDFAQKNKLLSWYVGGLNFQIEHHLFPAICHIHYKKLAPIVEKTAQEFGIPYRAKTTYVEAWFEHYKFLKELGKKEVLLTKSPPASVIAA